MILENNPFYAASLTPRAGGGFELINYDPVCKETTYSTRVMRTIGRNGPQVNVKFSVKPEGGLTIDGFDVFENGEKVEKTEDDDYYASAVLFDLFFVSESLHATIHMFHYALTNALAYASEDFGQLNKWAEEYNGNVNNKYNQVLRCAPALHHLLRDALPYPAGHHRTRQEEFRDYHELQTPRRQQPCPQHHPRQYGYLVP